jgi:hypothetical protein
MLATADHEATPFLGRLEEESLLRSLLDDVGTRGQALVPRVLAELEKDPWVTEVEVVAALGDDAGDALAIEQDQAAREAGGQLERVVVEQRAGLAQACGVIDRGARGLRRRPPDVQAGEQVGVGGPTRGSRAWAALGSARRRPSR